MLEVWILYGSLQRMFRIEPAYTVQYRGWYVKSIARFSGLGVASVSIWAELATRLSRKSGQTQPDSIQLSPLREFQYYCIFLSIYAILISEGLPAITWWHIERKKTILLMPINQIVSGRTIKCQTTLKVGIFCLFWLFLCLSLGPFS